ncbi:MAG: formylmethanofuran dehydrogenase subunit A [Sulfurifustaceae bacterium]
MLMKLAGGRVYDPAHGVDGQVRDLYVRDGRIVADPGPGARLDREFDLRGNVVMAGAIDLHTHIAGGKMNIARAMLPADHRHDPLASTAHTRAGSGHAAPSTFAAGYRYAEMGYTACFEPAIVPSNARHAHLEMGDTPMIDKGGYAMLGNDDFLLRLLAERAEQPLINDYVAWTLHATQCLGIKVVNPGGISAFKFNARRLDLDEPAPHYGVTPRAIVTALTRALHELGVPHPLHVHASNLGVPGNFATTLATMDAAEGLPIHLTHVQFHSYGTEGERKFSSAAAQIAEAVNAQPNVSIDVGQIMFGRTVTASADTMRQYANHRLAHPKKWLCMDIECEAGCGVVPFRYRDQTFVNALQWAIGLEIFLLAKDPWRVFLTTDHPNGAPFMSYPHLIRLLMDRNFRRRTLETLHPQAQKASVVGTLEREYSLYEIAILTRAAPARILGLSDRGHLGEGGCADITVYGDDADRERMFAKPRYVFKDGRLIVQDGKIVDVAWGATHVVRPAFDRSIERRLAPFFERYRTTRLQNFVIGDDEIAADGRGRLIVHACRV